MRKALNPKVGNYAYWVSRGEYHYIGNAHMAVRVSEMTDNLRKALAAQGIYEPNQRVSPGSGKTPLVQSDASGLDVARILIPGEKPRLGLEITPYLHVTGSLQYRLLMRSDGENVYVNELYFQAVKKVHSGEWLMSADIRSPLHLYGRGGEPLAVVLPCILRDNKYVVGVRS